MNDSRFDNMPLILETPEESLWEAEIKKLYSLCKELMVFPDQDYKLKSFLNIFNVLQFFFSCLVSNIK